MRSLAWFPLALLLSLAIGPVGAETLYNQDGVQMSATARAIEPGAATCRIREERHSTAEYERLKPNDGQPLNVWRVELVVANYSGRVLDYLNAHLNMESDWPPCDHWDGPETSYGPQIVRWTGPLMTIHEVGSIQPGEERREIRFVLAWHEDDPVLGRWDINYTFDDSPPADGGGNERPVQQTVSAPSEPRSNRSRILPEETCPDVSLGERVRRPCWMEIENHPGCYLWTPDGEWEGDTVSWTGVCVGGVASGRGVRTWSYTDLEGSLRVNSTDTGEMLAGKANGQWTLRKESLGVTVVEEGLYVAGRKQGHWVERFSNGNVREGTYVDNVKHGYWHAPSAGPGFWECYVNGKDDISGPVKDWFDGLRRDLDLPRHYGRDDVDAATELELLRRYSVWCSQQDP